MFATIFQILLLIGVRIVEGGCILLSIPTRLKKPIRCPPIDDKLLLLSASTLAEKIRLREITSATIIKLYISRIRAVNPILNAVVEDRFEAAIADAQKIDKMLYSTKLSVEELAAKYPLLGLPVTVKESIAVKGLSHAAGRVFPGGRKASDDAEVVKLVKNAGGIPLLVSNTPELCMNLETYNKVTGRTCNPYDTRRTPGGSSGGEGALLGAGASVIGIGSDIFGSVRLPAHFCGVWGHKPSPWAISVEGHYPSSKCKKAWNEIFNLGPMVRYTVDLPLLLNVMLENNFHSLLRLNEPVEVKDIKYYFMESDCGSLSTHSVNSEIVNAMRNLTTYLKTMHHCSVEKIHIKSLKYCSEIAYQKLTDVADIDNLFDNNGTGSIKEFLRYLFCKSDSVFTAILYGIVRKINSCLPNSYTKGCENKITKIKQDLLEILGDNGVLLYPCSTGVANIHNNAFGRFPDASYTGIFNCIGFPVTACPLGLNSKGLPMGIQVVASPNNDRLTLAVAQEIEKAFGGWIPPIFSEDIAYYS